MSPASRRSSSSSSPSLAHGTILVTGPTGSGKSTTLYSTLNILNDPTKNIITVENPVEYQVPSSTRFRRTTRRA